MSILQEYERIRKDMGSTRYDAIGDYLEEVNKDRDEEPEETTEEIIESETEASEAMIVIQPAVTETAETRETLLV